MQQQIKFGVIIATSLGRIEKLFGISLPSVMNQKRKPDYVLIVDDNENPEISRKIEEEINQINKKACKENIFYSKNLRTHGNSGTGAWNTGIEFYKSGYLSEQDYIAILDDDDSWNSDYLEKVENAVLNCEKLPDQVAAFLQRSDCEKPSAFCREDLTVENFLTGNPGIQGSNMIFKAGFIQNGNFFDEKISSCTDRDLMLSLLTRENPPEILVLPEVLVNHFAGKGTITYDIAKKEKGLDEFYLKHISQYSDENLLEKALERSERFFKYQNAQNVKKLWKIVHQCKDESKIVIGTALHNNAETLRNAVESVLEQKNLKSKVYILIADDNSSDNWKEKISDLLENENVLYWKVRFSNVSKTRNFINDFVKNYFGNVKLIGRLDSDDVYADEKVLSKIEEIKDKTDADFIIAGNYLKKNNQILEKTNNPGDELLNHHFLLERVRQMAEGTAENELPSCNVFMTPENLRCYPDVKSAEDHFLTARILWNKENLKVVIAKDVLLTVYSLNGSVTEENKTEDYYFSARKALYQEMINYDK